jgi:hypothetical protein
MTKTVRRVMIYDWLERDGQCTKECSGEQFSLKGKDFFRVQGLLWEVPFGGQSAIE